MNFFGYTNVCCGSNNTRSVHVDGRSGTDCARFHIKTGDDFAGLPEDFMPSNYIEEYWKYRRKLWVEAMTRKSTQMEK